MIRELDTIVLTHDVKEHSLERGDVGAVVHCYPDGNAFEVEFVTGEGITAAVLTNSTSNEIAELGKRLRSLSETQWVLIVRSPSRRQS